MHVSRIMRTKVPSYFTSYEGTNEGTKVYTLLGNPFVVGVWDVMLFVLFSCSFHENRRDGFVAGCNRKYVQHAIRG